MKMITVKKQTGIIILFIFLFTFFNNFKKENDIDPINSGSAKIERAFVNKQRNVQVQGSGTIIKVLRDDVKGSRHQRFIIRVAEDLTILIAHNIDLAPRVDKPAKGENISFYGEYEWNNKGGVIHWTHLDPQKRHPDGWLKYKDKLYQ